MSKKIVDKIAKIESLKPHRSVLKNIIMDYYSLGNLTHGEASTLIKKYRLQTA